MSYREEVINVELARLLCQKGLNAKPENIIGHRKMPDILILIDGVRLILEGKFGNKEILVAQAKSRIEDGLCDVSIAVEYENELKVSDSLDKLHIKLYHTTYHITLFYQGETQIHERILDNASIQTIVEVINNTAKLVLDTDILRNIVAYVEDIFEELVAHVYSSSVKFDDRTILTNLKDLLGIDDLNQLEQKHKKDVLRIAFFVLLDAMLFQEGLCNINTDIKSISYSHKPYKSFFIDSWEKILKIDYKSIFQIALQILSALPNGSSDTERILKTIKELSLKVINSGLLVKHDFMGRIYHRLLLKTTGQYYATYYTAVPSAYLLANLVFKTPNNNWNFDDLEFLKHFKIIDPSCGSGTLLSASYNALRHMYSHILNPTEFEEFHRVILESAIYGWDVLGYAAHLTLTVLCLHNPRVLISKSNIYKLPNGIDKMGKTCLGSISMMDPHLDIIEERINAPVEIQGIQEKESSYSAFKVKESLFDVIIMNPPFSRSAKPNTKFGYSDQQIKSAMTRELNKVITRNGLNGIGQAGLGAVFIALSKDMINLNGRIGLVIPRAILTGVSWSKIRDILYSNFEVKYIISNYDTGDQSTGIEPWNWSEDTKLGEVMIVAERNDKSENEKETIYINLWNKPENEIDSIFYAHQVITSVLSSSIKDHAYDVITTRDKQVGSFFRIRQKFIKDNWLTPCLFASPELNYLAIELPNKYPVTKLSNLLNSDGVDIKQIKDTFEQTDNDTFFHIVWGQQSSMNKINLDKKHIGNGRVKKSNAETLFDRGTTFLLSERPHLSNDCVIAMKTSRNVLATAFWELEFKDKKIEPLMLLWFNSTPGLIMYLSASTNSMGEIFKTKKQQLEKMNVLNPSMCSEAFINKADEFYNIIKDNEFCNFEMEFKLACIDTGLRRKIDEFFNRELDIDLDFDMYYNALIKEPIITKKRMNIPNR